MTTNTDSIQPLLDQMTGEHKDKTLVLLNDTLFDLATVLKTMEVMVGAVEHALAVSGDIEAAYATLRDLILQATSSTDEGGALSGHSLIAVQSSAVYTAVTRTVEQVLAVADDIDSFLAGDDGDLEDALVKSLSDAGMTAEEINALLGL